MAKKSTVAKKTTASTKGAAKVSTKSAQAKQKQGTTKPGSNTLSGLQMSSARWKAYDAAYNATSAAAWKAYTASQALAYHNAALNAATLNLRKARLNAAYSTQKKAAAAHAAARTAAIAAFATKMSYRQSRLAHQNAALTSRVFANYQRHVLKAGRLQFSYKGERTYAHTAVMRTLTTAQARTITQARFAAAAKTAKKAVRSTVTKTRVASPASKAEAALIKQTAQAAGLAAARTVPLPPKVVKAKAPRTAPAPPWLPRPSVPAWFGDPEGEDCVAAAIANHMLTSTGMAMQPWHYTELVRGLGPAPDITDALRYALRHQCWVRDGLPMLIGWSQAVTNRLPALIGFNTTEGGHAAVVIGGSSLATWGELIDIADVVPPGTVAVDVEEAWDLRWIMLREC